MCQIEAAQPFGLRGVDSDGGGEFLNHHLYGYLQEQGIRQTRSRPCRKNDQAHVEQKNYTHVRQLLGYERLGHSELVGPINELLGAWSLWKNLFCTTMEQLSATQEGSKQKRRHVKTPQTPAQRLLGSGQLSEQQRQGIKERLAANSPFVMKAHVEARLKAVWERRKELLQAEVEGGGRPCVFGDPCATLRERQKRSSPHQKQKSHGVHVMRQWIAQPTDSTSYEATGR